MGGNSPVFVIGFVNNIKTKAFRRSSHILCRIKMPAPDGIGPEFERGQFPFRGLGDCGGGLVITVGIVVPRDKQSFRSDFSTSDLTN